MALLGQWVVHPFMRRRTVAARARLGGARRREPHSAGRPIPCRMVSEQERVRALPYSSLSRPAAIIRRRSAAAHL